MSLILDAVLNDLVAAFAPLVAMLNPPAAMIDTADVRGFAQSGLSWVVMPPPLGFFLVGKGLCLGRCPGCFHSPGWMLDTTMECCEMLMGALLMLICAILIAAMGILLRCSVACCRGTALEIAFDQDEAAAGETAMIHTTEPVDEQKNISMSDCECSGFVSPCRTASGRAWASRAEEHGSDPFLHANLGNSLDNGHDVSGAPD